MQVVGLDLAAAAYIFNNVLDQDELLVPNPHCAVTRGALRTLEPGKPIVDDVLILLASMLTQNSSRVQWFLPTTLTQIATGRGQIPWATVEAIRKDFMGMANNVCKIFAPIWSDNHWFLLVVDIVGKELVYLDSLKSAARFRAKRIRQIKKVAIFLEELLDDDSWYEKPTDERLLISDYKLYEPKVVEQDDRSNDCGMYVAQWMILYHLWSSYEVAKVSYYSRMRLGIDMVLKYHNENRLPVIESAIEYWRTFTRDPPTTK
ncbi:hypothetical protein AHAS_Ahas01G0090500 [Arachis hypogaea]